MSSSSNNVSNEPLSEDGLNAHNQQNNVTSNLVTSRARYADELKNPAVLAHLYNSIKAEVGGQDTATKLKYLESILNRAAARGMTINDTVTSDHRKGGYYPAETIDQLNDPNPPDYSQILAEAMDGSNTSNFATGNESGKVRSGDAPIVSVGNKEERFVIENADAKWAKSNGSDLVPIVSSGKVPGEGGQSQQASEQQQATTVKPYQPAATTTTTTPEEQPTAKVEELPVKPWATREATAKKYTSAESDDEDQGLYASGAPKQQYLGAQRVSQPSQLADVLNEMWDQYG